MKTIVCPVDFSETSEKAALYAAKIGMQIGAELVLAHAQHVPVIEAQAPVSALNDLIEEKRLSVSQNLDQLASRLKSAVACNIRTWQTIGLVVDMIKEIEEESPIAMVVMGTQGVTNAIDRWVGTTSIDVMSRCDVPVIIIPSGVEFTGWKKVGYATDFSQDTDNGILDFQEFIKPFAAELSIVHVSNKKVDAEEMLAVVRHFEPKANVDTIIGSNVVIELNDYVWENELQLLALKRHKRNFFDRLFHKSVSRELAITAEVPILIF